MKKKVRKKIVVKKKKPRYTNAKTFQKFQEYILITHGELRREIKLLGDRINCLEGESRLARLLGEHYAAKNPIQTQRKNLGLL